MRDNNVLFIDQLRKEFGSKVAVNGINLTMYNNEIFALLGHNGAGKTTTMNMISGLLNPTTGTIKFKGVDLLENLQKVRTTLGVCPQLDVLFDDMTVQEHLEMF